MAGPLGFRRATRGTAAATMTGGETRLRRGSRGCTADEKSSVGGRVLTPRTASGPAALPGMVS